MGFGSCPAGYGFYISGECAVPESARFRFNAPEPPSQRQWYKECITWVGVIFCYSCSPLLRGSCSNPQPLVFPQTHNQVYRKNKKKPKNFPIVSPCPNHIFKLAL